MAFKLQETQNDNRNADRGSKLMQVTYLHPPTFLNNKKEKIRYIFRGEEESDLRNITSKYYGKKVTLVSSSKGSEALRGKLKYINNIKLEDTSSSYILKASGLRTTGGVLVIPTDLNISKELTKTALLSCRKYICLKDNYTDGLTLEKYFPKLHCLHLVFNNQGSSDRLKKISSMTRLKTIIFEINSLEKKSIIEENNSEIDEEARDDGDDIDVYDDEEVRDDNNDIDVYDEEDEEDVTEDNKKSNNVQKSKGRKDSINEEEEGDESSEEESSKDGNEGSSSIEEEQAENLSIETLFAIFAQFSELPKLKTVVWRSVNIEISKREEWEKVLWHVERAPNLCSWFIEMKVNFDYGFINFFQRSSLSKETDVLLLQESAFNSYLPHTQSNVWKGVLLNNPPAYYQNNLEPEEFLRVCDKIDKVLSFVVINGKGTSWMVKSFTNLKGLYFDTNHDFKCESRYSGYEIEGSDEDEEEEEEDQEEQQEEDKDTSSEDEEKWDPLEYWLENLKYLCVRYCGDFSYGLLETLKVALESKGTPIEKLYLFDSRVTLHDSKFKTCAAWNMNKLPTQLRNMKSLKELNITYDENTDKNLFKKVFSRMTALEKLTLRYCEARTGLGDIKDKFEITYPYHLDKYLPYKCFENLKEFKLCILRAEKTTVDTAYCIKRELGNSWADETYSIWGDDLVKGIRKMKNLEVLEIENENLRAPKKGYYIIAGEKVKRKKIDIDTLIKVLNQCLNLKKLRKIVIDQCFEKVTDLDDDKAFRGCVVNLANNLPSLVEMVITGVKTPTVREIRLLK